MKFCSNCGSEIDSNQSFCKECGKQLDTNKQDNMEREQLSSNTTNKKREQDNKKKNNKKPFIIIVSIIVASILIIVLIFSGFILYNNVIKGDKISSIFHLNNNTPEINVLSDEFSNDFMKADNTSGFKGFDIGMSKGEVQKQHGSSNSKLKMGIGEVYKYGDIGVYYGIDNTVSSVYVLPKDVTVNEFKNFHGTPTVETDSQLVYDDNQDNGFTILINVKNDKIESVENTYQISEESLDNMKMNATNDNLSLSFQRDAQNYVGGIEKTLDTAFDDEDTSQTKEMVSSWDGLLDDIENDSSTNSEQKVVTELKYFQSERDAIIDNIDEMNDNHNAKAWQDAQQDYEELKAEISVFTDEYED